MRRIVVFVALVALTVGSVASIVSEVEAQEVMSKLVMKAGKKVWLFHSGTPDVMKEICPNEVIPVYREVKVGNKYKVEVVGKVKVLSSKGRNYFEAKVISGEARVGDIATKKAASCLVLPPR
jgi:hypothetical protein